MAVTINYLIKNRLIWLFATVSFLAHAPLLSKYLEDWDSVQFALALSHYSLPDHLPHPPGYPLYVMIGKIVDVFLQNPAQSLAFVSLISGSLSLVMIFFLTKKMFDATAAWVTVAIVAILPVVNMMSIVGLSNMPGQLFLLTFVLLIFNFQKSTAKIPYVALFAGLILGVRVTELPIIVSILGLVLVKNWQIKLFVKTALAFCAGVAIWLLPLVLYTGIDKFIQSYTWTANYIFTHDTLQGAAAFGIDSQLVRLSKLANLSSAAFGNFLPGVFIAAGIWLLFKKCWQDDRYQFLATWFLSYFFVQVTFYNLEVTRYLLPLAVPGAIVVSTLPIWRQKKYFLLLVAALISFGLTFNQTVSQLTRFAQTIPPTIAPVLYVKDHYQPANTMLITTFTYRQFQYYAPEFVNYYQKIPPDLKFDTSAIVIIDFWGLKDQISQLSHFLVVDSLEFRGDWDIFPRISEVDLYVLKKR
ncbi:glycosyltransferase family 39 protein [Candidatus Daviesbacteria bacterium]|nr:glycosyltransferase family 39 protein [Candidatus Daviesbacteria bacterium]